MATVDIAYREWLTRFKEANPTIADNPTVLEVVRITWDASKKAERAKHKEAATMADVELLPLPGHFAHQSERVQEHVRAYARANLAPLQAENERLQREVEALRAELDKKRTDGVHTCGDHCKREACVLRRRAERLEEALRAFPAEPNPYTYRIAHAKALAALAQEDRND